MRQADEPEPHLGDHKAPLGTDSTEGWAHLKEQRNVKPLLPGEKLSRDRNHRSPAGLLHGSQTGWGLGPTAAVLAPGHMSPPAAETKKL